MKYLDTDLVDETLRNRLDELEKAYGHEIAEAQARARIEQRSLSGEPIPYEVMIGSTTAYRFLRKVLQAVDAYMQRLDRAAQRESIAAINAQPAVTTQSDSDKQLAELRRKLRDDTQKLYNG